jgi:hypothetical protein
VAFIDDVIDFAAEGVERGDRATLVRRQEEKAVVEAGTAAGGFLLAIFVGGHSQSLEVHRVAILTRLAGLVALT